MKTCNKCGIEQPLDCFHTEMRRGVRKHKARCVSCVREEWADRRALLRGEAAGGIGEAMSGWDSVVTYGHISPSLGLRP